MATFSREEFIVVVVSREEFIVVGGGGVILAPSCGSYSLRNLPGPQVSVK